MLREHYSRYLQDRYDLKIDKIEGENIIEGTLADKSYPSKTYPIANSIPRFLDDFRNNYADNFGLQWNLFKSTQLDSVSGIDLTYRRFWNNTKWTREELKGKKVLEVGSGAGRFTEIILASGAQLVSFDYSNAVEANYNSNKNKGDLFLFQASVYDIPFPDNYFDYVFCYGVLQHTPNPEKSYECMYNKLKPGGKLSVDSYKKQDLPKYWPHFKYTWRKYTTKMKPQTLLKIIKFYMPIWQPIDTFLRTAPIPLRLGHRIAYRSAIPCWNYLDLGLTKKQRLEWGILDTFDALGAQHDHPRSLEEIKKMVEYGSPARTDVFLGSNGVVANVTK
jgi:ubiquinone/menaquinone biosynthesis C-methylase UbiE